MKSASKEKSNLEKDTIIEIKNQVEYYLSDENLEKDSFFHEKISSSANGYLDLELLLKCNKIKNKGWTKEDLKKGIELSDALELDKTGEKVRKKGNLELPELLLLAKKRKKDNKKKEDEKDDKKGGKKDPIIFKITCKEKSASSWKAIFDEFKKLNPELDVEYGRFKETEGHIGVLLKKDQKLENLTLVDKFKVDEIEFTVTKCEGEDLINFWKDHGSHYEFCTKQREKRNISKENKAQKKKKYLNKNITLGKTDYNNIDLVKSHTRNIINKYKDNEKLVGDDKDFVLDLLKYHHNYDIKVKDMDYIIVDKNPNYKFSRCFYIVDKNKNKIDFSSKKCIENIIEKLNSE